MPLPGNVDIENTQVNPPSEADVKDDRDFLAGIAEPEVKAPDKKEVEEEEDRGSLDKEEEEKEGDEESKKEDEEDEEELPEFLVNRPTWSAIKAKYPEFFKDFPAMKHVIGREFEYSKMFPTIEDAQEAQESSENYAFLNEKFDAGDSKEILNLMKEANQKSYDKFTSEFLSSLYESDKETYFGVVTPVVHNILHSVFTAAKGKDENLYNAVLVLSEHLFNDMNVVTKPAQAQKVEIKENKQETDFMEKRLIDSRNIVNSEVTSQLQDLVFNAFESQFEDGKIPKALEGIVADLVETGFRKIDRQMMADEGYIRTMKSLWKKAYNSGFTGDWKERIVSAYLSRAKELIPGVTKKLDAFKPRKTDVEEKDKTEKRHPNSSGRSSDTKKVYSSKEIDWRKTSDRDFLDGNIKLKS